MFRVSEEAIEQYDDKGLLKIAPLTSNTCLPTNQFVLSRNTHLFRVFPESAKEP